MRIPAELTTRLGHILAARGVKLEGARLDEAAARLLDLGVLMTRLAIHRSEFDEALHKRDRP